MTLTSATHRDVQVGLDCDETVDGAPAATDGDHSDHAEDSHQILADARRRWSRGRIWFMIVISCAVLMTVAAGAYLVLAGPASHASVDARVVGPAPVPAGSLTYSNAAAGYTVNYPASWRRTAGPSNSVLFNLNGQDAVSIEDFPLKSAVNTGNLAAMRSVTDAILSDPTAHLTVLMTQQVSIGGLNGLYYLYYFPNGKGQEGVHGHYFLFHGTHMYTLVFQASSAAAFQHIASSFDAIADSFRVTGK